MDRLGITKKQLKRISFEKEEFENAIKLPELEKIDFSEPAAGYSSHLAAICNSEGLLFYAIGNKVALLDRQGLTQHLAHAKNKADHLKTHYSFKDYQAKGLGCIIDFGVGDEGLVQLIEVREDPTNPLLVVAFKDRIKSLAIKQLASAAPSLTDDHKHNRDADVTSLRVLPDDIFFLDSKGRLNSVRGKTKVPADLQDKAIIDCRIALHQSTSSRMVSRLCWP